MPRRWHEMKNANKINLTLTRDPFVKLVTDANAKGQ